MDSPTPMNMRRYGQADETLGGPGQRGERAPGRQAAADQPGAVGGVCQRAHEQPGGGVEEEEEQAGEQPELGVGQAQIRNDEVGEAGQQLAVDEVHHVQQREKGQKGVAARAYPLIVHLLPSNRTRKLTSI